MNINIDRYKNILQSEGYKLTNQRNAILNAFVENHSGHYSSEEIFNIVSKDYPDIGIATVYRTLQLFEKINIVHKVNFDDGFSRFELNLGPEDNHHHHLICLKCGKILEIRQDLLKSIDGAMEERGLYTVVDHIEKEGLFTIVDHNVKFYGYCNDCSELIKEE